MLKRSKLQKPVTAAEVAAVADALYLKLDQTTPETVTASPIWNWGTQDRIPFYSATKTLTDSDSFTFDGAVLRFGSTSSIKILDDSSSVRIVTTAINGGAILRSYPILRFTLSATHAPIYGADIGFQDQRTLTPIGAISGSETGSYGLRAGWARDPSFTGTLNYYILYGLFFNIVDGGVYNEPTVLNKFATVTYKGCGSMMTFSPTVNIGAANTYTYNLSGLDLSVTANNPVVTTGIFVQNYKGIVLSGELTTTGTSTGYGIHFSMTGADTLYCLYNATAASNLLGIDNSKSLFGTGLDASIYYDGTDLVINPDEVGAGKIYINSAYKLPNVDGNANEYLKTDGAGTCSWAAGSGVSFGLDNQVPYTNATTDDFDYSAGFTFNGTSLQLNTNSATALLVEQDGVNDNTLIVDTANGRVGIGIAPITKLHLGQPAGGSVLLTFTNALGSGITDGTYIGIVDAGHAYYWNNENADLIFGTKNTFRMVISSAGYVGIGSYADCVSPSEVLQVGGNIWAKRDNDSLIFGLGKDASVYYDGTNLLINPKVVGTGYLNVVGSVEVDDNIDVEKLIKYENAFTFTLTASSSTASVTFPTAFGTGITPIVICTPPYQTSFWVTSITNTGFTFNVGTTNGYAQTINCIAMETS